MPDAPDGRLERVERRVDEHDRLGAQLEVRVNDLDRRVSDLTPLLASVVTLTVEFKNMRDDLSGFMRRVDERDREREQERLQDRKDREAERRTSRQWLIGLAIMLVCALIGAGALILVSAP